MPRTRRDPRSSAGAHPAKTSPSQDAAPASTVIGVGFGGSSPVFYEYSIPTSSSGRTLQLPLLELYLPFSERLPPSGSMRNGEPSERPMLAPRTSATASSSSRHKAAYPTPTASPYGKSRNARGHEDRRRESLDTMAARWSKSEMFPTPLASDSQGGPRQPDGKRGMGLVETAARWSTPTAHDGSSTGSKPRPRQGGASLRTQVERWPTATATDCRDSGAAGYSTASGRHSGTTLTDAARLHDGRPLEETSTAGPDGLVLCPEFVEGLMGFPEGWTLVDDELASAALATQSSPRKRPRRS